MMCCNCSGPLAQTKERRGTTPLTIRALARPWLVSFVLNSRGLTESSRKRDLTS